MRTPSTYSDRQTKQMSLLWGSIMKKYKLDITFINANGLKETQRCIDVVCFDYMTVINTLVIYQSKKSWYKQLPDYIFYIEVFYEEIFVINFSYSI